MKRINEIHVLNDEDSDHVSKKYELPKLQLANVIGGKQPLTYPGIENQNVLLSNELSFNKEGVSFNNVYYTYPGAGNEPVLNDITVNIPVGKTTAIVGMSGSGKTTFLKLLLKYYEPQEGNININGLPLLHYNHKLWRSKCGTVMQDSYIFPDTIAQNIALGEEKINKTQLIDAAKTANIYEFIEELPLGFETKIGVEGHGISIGQRQRILIARAVYKDPEFIFFDEATNSLDTNNERIIHDNLQQFFNKRTVIIVAHRLSTVKAADQILVLKKGNIIEKGTHKELIAIKGEYYTLVKNQLELGD
jgi:ATP-binding cassette subfamily B protein